MEYWNKFKFALPLVVIFSCVACQGLVLKPPPEPEPVPEPPEQEATPEPLPPPDNMPASKRVRKALQLLEQGDYENARNQLTWALQEKPGLQMADQLVEQIDADPIEFLGVKNFYYQVESGDSLSIIAGKFLDDPMKFVILARYNHLENPSKLAPGDRIRVPGEMPEQVWKKPKHKPRKAKSSTAGEGAAAGRESRAPEGGDKPAQPTEPTGAGQTHETETTGGPGARGQTVTPSGSMPRQESVSPQPSLDEVLETARKLHAAGDLPAAIYQLESEGSRFANAKAMQSLQTTYNREYADLLMRQGDLEKARGVLEKLVLLDASDEKAINDLIRVEDKLEARKLYRQGKDLLAAGSVEEAYQSFTQALTYDPNNALAKQAQLESRDKLTDQYHREAMRYFRRQELEKAIVLWDKILALDPKHPLAPGYKARAVEMQQKLQQIDSGRE